MVLSHTDTVDIAKGCGWAGRVEVELQAGPDRAALPARYIEAATVEQFIKYGYTTRTLIESHNLELQTAALRAVLENTHAHVERGTTLDTSTMLTDDLLGHVLVITSPSVVKYTSLIGALNAHGSSSVGPYNTYYSQVGYITEAIADARLFTGALHVKDVRLLALSNKDHEKMERWKAALGSEIFMRGIGLTLVIPKSQPDMRRPSHR
jgi:hypothetical protein